MSETDKVFAGSIPENYDRYLVPLIFEDFAEDIAQRVASLSSSDVLETAAGSGVVTRALTPKLARDASYIVTDLNQPMLHYAATRQAPDIRITWRRADAQALIQFLLQSKITILRQIRAGITLSQATLAGINPPSGDPCEATAS
jgi:ubiquinone/menaquinone biosynthesis C-methylase UbiE